MDPASVTSFFPFRPTTVSNAVLQQPYELPVCDGPCSRAECRLHVYTSCAAALQAAAVTREALHEGAQDCHVILNRQELHRTQPLN